MDLGATCLGQYQNALRLRLYIKHINLTSMLYIYYIYIHVYYQALVVYIWLLWNCIDFHTFSPNLKSHIPYSRNFFAGETFVN